VTIAKSGAPNGDAQAATVATALTDSLRVVVLEDGSPKAGATVSWGTTSGGSVSPSSAQTDANGLAATRWTLGQTAGAQTARATLSGATGSPVTFSATGNPGPATAFTLDAGNAQFALINQAFTTPLTVKVADQFGNGISGATVNWAVQSGSLTISGGATSNTNAAGIASNTITAGGTAGSGQIRATTAAVPAVNIDFSTTTYRAIVAATITTTFRSRHNNTVNPAVDTVQAGQSVLWTVDGGHTVQSQGAPSFTSSGNLITGQTYSVTFNTPGTYQYDCAIHGALMTGRVVVLP
jgi:plastocyanin